MAGDSDLFAGKSLLLLPLLLLLFTLAAVVVVVVVPLVGLRFATTCRLLNVGQPAQAEEPPVPSQRPSPGHVPFACWESGAG
jgi:hypothetical protein